MRIQDLDKRHLEDLRSSGLSDHTILAAGIWSASPERASALFGREITCRALVFPYNGSCLYRLKPDVPYHFPGEQDKKPAKYLAPIGSKNHLYYPKNIWGFYASDGARGWFNLPRECSILISEGEKKALKADQEGWLCLGLGGVWSWVEGKYWGQRVPIKSLDAISWSGKNVFIVFDSDAVVKKAIMYAESELRRNLSNRGAKVRIVRLPQPEEIPSASKLGLDKVGLDDYLCHCGPDEFRDLLEATNEKNP